MVSEKSNKFCVIFINQRTPDDQEGYDQTAQQMLDLAQRQPGYLDHFSLRDEKGLGITISYWESKTAIEDWKNNLEHAAAREKGRKNWYENYLLQVCRVEREYKWTG